MLFIFFSARQRKAENLLMSHVVGDQKYHIGRVENWINNIFL